MKWREIGPYLRELWQRPAGPMNWKNPIRIFAIAGWLVIQGFVLLGRAGFRLFQGFLLLAWAGFRVGQFVAGLPPLPLFFFAAVGWAGWSFVHRPFPPLDEHPILVLVEYHTPNFFDALVVWYYVTPFAVVMLTGFISVTIWRVWLEGRRSDFASFSKLPPWPLDPKQKAPAIVIGEVHHPVEAREVFNPSWLTIPERLPVYRRSAKIAAAKMLRKCLAVRFTSAKSPFVQSLLQPPPFPLALDDSRSVLAVKGSLRRFAP